MNILDEVINDLRFREAMGAVKCSPTINRSDLAALPDSLQQAYEDCLDQAIYLKRALLLLERVS